MTKARDLGDFISDGAIAETVTADGLNLGDNETIQLGDSQDLLIWHSGNNSHIRDAGTGNLLIQTNGTAINMQGTSGENYAIFNDNGAVTLNYDNSVKFSTTATGATVTGTIAVSGDFNATSGTFTVQSNGTDILNVTSTLMSPQTDGAISLGSASNAFNNLHLDGAATVAGTVTAASFAGDGSGLTGVGFTTNVITSNTTATKDNHYYINGSAITLTLPASPSVGDEVRFSEVAGNTNCILARNGSNIMSAAQDLTIDTAYLVLYVRYVDATIGWAFS
jgi:hypothetical protein